MKKVLPDRSTEKHTTYITVNFFVARLPKFEENV